MVNEYTIKCKLCNQSHYPIFGERKTVSIAIGDAPKSITLSYICPVTHKDAEVTFPYNAEIYGKTIVGWRSLEDPDNSTNARSDRGVKAGSSVLTQMILVTGGSKITSNYKQISDIAKLIGSKIMGEQNWILLNGGVSEISNNEIISVDNLVCIGAKKKLEESKKSESEKDRIITLVPQIPDRRYHDIGKKEFSGTNANERRANLVMKADAIIAIEGGLGTADIIELGIGSKKPVLPIACTGGESEKTWNTHEDDILRNFALNKMSDEYKLITHDGLERAEDLADLIIELTKRTINHSFGSTTEPSETSKQPVDLISISNEFFNDIPTQVDKLGRESVAFVVSNKLQKIWKDNDIFQKEQKKSTDVGAFLLNIDGQWGSGKTSLFNLIKARLKKMDLDVKNKWITIEFNAWRHQRFDPPWWFLMNQVYKQSMNQLPNISSKRRSKFRRYLRKRRITFRENWWRIFGGRSKVPLGIAIGLLILGLLIIFDVFDLTDLSQILPKNLLVKYFNDLTGYITILASIIPTIYGLKNSLFPASGQAAQNFMRLDRDPSEQISRHFEFLVDQVKQPIAIFIDDLDRCKENYVVEFLEGVQTLFRGCNVIFIIAADKRWIYTSYGYVYKTFNSINEPGRSIGTLFLEKIFQLTIPVPKVSPYYKTRYLEELLGSYTPEDEEALRNKAKEEIQKLTPPQLLTELNKEKTPVYEQVFKDEAIKKLEGPIGEKYTEHWLVRFSPLMEENPRAMKRLLNIFSIYRTYAIIGRGPVDYFDLAIWTILKIRWPDLAEYFENKPKMIDQIGNLIDKDREVPRNLKYLFSDKKVEQVVNAENISSRLTSEKLSRLIER